MSKPSQENSARQPDVHPSGTEPHTDILAMQEFVEKLGGIERARLAIETLAELGEAA